MSLALSSLLAFALTVNAFFYESLPSLHLSVVLATLVTLHVFLRPRLVFSREAAVYACFCVYMVIQVAWTPNRLLALNTLVPAGNFVIILVLVSSLITFHNTRVVLAGLLGGFIAGAAVFTLATRFPLVYPPDFSYNAAAVAYFFGLFVALVLNNLQRSMGALLVVCLVLMGLIVATTSIKTNLGIALGALAAALAYLRTSVPMIFRHAIPVVVLAGLVGAAVLSNDALSKRLNAGVTRVSLGIEVLKVRENVRGYSGFDSRSRWVADGIEGWRQSPLFGHGVEALRNDIGITSHVTPVDLLYNSGLIGLFLFYAMFLFMLLRLREARAYTDRSLRMILFGSLVAIFAITLASTMHYSAFLAAYAGIVVALTRPAPRKGVSIVTPVVRPTR